MKVQRPLAWDPEKEQFNDPEANRLLDRPERKPYGAFHAARQAGFKPQKNLRGAAS
jgi:hypothetical protein